MPISKQPSPADVTYNDSFLAVTGWPHMISRFPFLQRSSSSICFSLDSSFMRIMYLSL